jgi:hypothetical protein
MYKQGAHAYWTFVVLWLEISVKSGKNSTMDPVPWVWSYTTQRQPAEKYIAIKEGGGVWNSKNHQFWWFLSLSIPSLQYFTDSSIINKTLLQ